MANLVITIISIALVAVTALVGGYFISDNSPTLIAKTRANTLISQSRQLYAADLKYMIENGKGSFNDFGPDEPVIANYLTGRMPVLGFDMTASPNGNTTGFLPLSSANLHHILCGDYNAGSIPYVLDGYKIYGMRSNGRIFNKDSIIYSFYGLTSSVCGTAGAAVDLSPANMATHPLVQICKQINNNASLPAGLRACL